MNEKKKLQARDFITIGIFTAILWVVQMVIMYLGFLSPLIVAGYAVLIPIVTGIPMMLYYARIEKFGMLTITSVIVAILLFIFGMGLLLQSQAIIRVRRKQFSVMLCFRCGLPQATSHLLLQLIPTRQVFLKAVMMNPLSTHCLRL